MWSFAIGVQRCMDFTLSHAAHMHQCDGAASKSVAVLDTHHVSEVTDLYAQAKIVVIFLPPYSPDLNSH